MPTRATDPNRPKSVRSSVVVALETLRAAVRGKHRCLETQDIQPPGHEKWKAGRSMHNVKWAMLGEKVKCWQLFHALCVNNSLKSVDVKYTLDYLAWTTGEMAKVAPCRHGHPCAGQCRAMAHVVGSESVHVRIIITSCWKSRSICSS